MHYSILDKERLNILPSFKFLKDRFYLAGGTALALHLGHRDSIDFDFFTQEDIDTKSLFNEIIEALDNHSIVKTQEENNTLSVIIDDTVKLSFFTYKYKMLNEAIDEPYLNIASVADIACMKLSAVTGRATNKDYIDLYFILDTFSLDELLELSIQKHNNLDINLILKSLVYFDDIEDEPIVFKEGNYVKWQEVQKRLINSVKELK